MSVSRVRKLVILQLESQLVVIWGWLWLKNSRKTKAKSICVRFHWLKKTKKKEKKSSHISENQSL